MFNLSGDPGASDLALHLATKVGDDVTGQSVTIDGDREELRPNCLSLFCQAQNATRSIACDSFCQKGLAPLFKYNFSTQLSYLTEMRFTRIIVTDGRIIT